MFAGLINYHFGQISKYLLAVFLILFSFAFFVSAQTFAFEPNDERMIGPDPNNWTQWGLQKIDAAGAWDTTQGSSNIKIAIIDSGINEKHKDLQGKVVGRVNFSCERDTDDYQGRRGEIIGHGTIVAGIAAAATNNREGIAGLGFNSSLLNVKVTGENCQNATPAVLKQAVDWSVQAGAKVISISLASGAYGYDPSLDASIQNAWNSGVVVVAAAGNDNSSSPRYPAAYKNVISVGATNKDDSKVTFSNYGNWVSVAAPGFDILGPCGGSNVTYCSTHNTSVATPFVSGLAALIWAQHAGEAGFDQADVKNLIESTADKIAGTGTYWVNGRINACKALGNTKCPLPTIIKIYAAGTSAYLEYPNMELLIDDVVVKTFSSISGDPAAKPYQKYFYTAYLPQPLTDASRVKIRFTSDDRDPITGADRDLFIDKISINGVDFEAEAPDTYSTGFWNGTSCQSGYFNSETLACNGYIQFKKPPVVNVDLVGTYNLHVICASSCSGGPWDHVLNISTYDPVSGNYSGTGYYVSDPSFVFTISGTVTGDQMTMIILGSGSYPAGFRTDGLGTISPDGSISGTAFDTLGRHNTWTATKQVLGLMAYWKMDEPLWNGTLAEVLDQVSPSNNGTAINGAITGPGKFGNAGFFDGIDDFVRTPYTSNLNITNDYTMAAWIKRNTLSDFGSIISKTHGTSWLWDFDMGICQANVGSCGGSNDTLFLHSSGMSPYTIVSNRTISDTTDWHHVAITRSGTTVTLYIDGDSAGTTTQTGIVRNDAFGIQIGSDGTWDSRSYFNGQIDEARVYNQALTPTEIRALYNLVP